MERISRGTTLTNVERILGSDSGVLDFEVADDDTYYVWEGEDREDADWTVENVDRVENDNEDRFIMFPEGDGFTCEIDLNDDGWERARCWCE